MYPTGTIFAAQTQLSLAKRICQAGHSIARSISWTGYPDYILRDAFKVANSRDCTQLLNLKTKENETNLVVNLLMIMHLVPRVGEHFNDIWQRSDTAISRHMWSHHSSDTLSIRFIGIYLVQHPIRRGDWDRLMLQRESESIFRLNTVQPNGLNEQLNFGCFI